MRPAHFEVDDLDRRRRAATARLGVSKERAQGAAFAELAQTAERQAITIGELAIAIFGPARQRPAVGAIGRSGRSEEHTSELQSLMRISYAVFCLKKNKKHKLDRQHECIITVKHNKQ